jgi:hypothetical protein
MKRSAQPRGIWALVLKQLRRTSMRLDNRKARRGRVALALGKEQQNRYSGSPNLIGAENSRMHARRRGGQNLSKEPEVGYPSTFPPEQAALNSVDSEAEMIVPGGLPSATVLCSIVAFKAERTLTRRGRLISGRRRWRGRSGNQC